MIEVGDTVPEFSLQGSDGKTYAPKNLRGHKWVIYFYPKDMTPGCTREACDFTENIQQFIQRGITVLGVSGGSVESKRKFIASSKIGFPLLADEDFGVAKAFGSYGPRKFLGKSYQGVLRSTFLIDEKGIVEKVWSNVKVKGHADSVLASLSAQASS